MINVQNYRTFTVTCVSEIPRGGFTHDMAHSVGCCTYRAKNIQSLIKYENRDRKKSPLHK